MKYDIDNSLDAMGPRGYYHDDIDVNCVRHLLTWWLIGLFHVGACVTTYCYGIVPGACYSSRICQWMAFYH